MKIKATVLVFLIGSAILIGGGILSLNINQVDSGTTGSQLLVSHQPIRNTGLPITNGGFSFDSVTGTTPPSSGTWSISTETVVANETLIINGSIEIKSGGALVLINSTLRINSAFNGSNYIFVYGGGNLTLIDSRITAHNPSFRYYMMVYSGAIFYMTGSEISYAGYTYFNKKGICILANNVYINNSKFLYNFFGLSVDSGSNITIQLTEIAYSEKEGISIGTSSVKVLSSYIHDNGGSGIYISEGGNTIMNTNFTNDGIVLLNSNNNTIVNNLVNGKPLVYLENANGVSVMDAGQVIIVNSSDINVVNVRAINGDAGVEIFQSRDVTVKDSFFENNAKRGGIFIYSSETITITNNTIRNNIYGVYAYLSNNLTITDNVLSNDGIFLFNSFQNTVENNFVNGKQLVYIEQKSGLEVSDAGMVIVNNASNVVIRDLVFDGVETGIFLFKAENISIIESEFKNSDFRSLYVLYSDNITVKDSIFTNNYIGLHLIESTGLNAVHNVFASNYEGIVLSAVSSPQINFNDIIGNDVGIHMGHVEGFLIALNNFINNTLHIRETSVTGSYNNTTYGNYWSDYLGNDTNGDLIGDDPYEVESGYYDHHPLTSRILWFKDTPYILKYWETTKGTTYFKANIIGEVWGEVYFWFAMNSETRYVEASYDEISGTFHAEVTYTGVTNARILLVSPIDKPRIMSINWLPEAPNVNESILVQVNISNSEDVLNVILTYYLNGWHNISMTYNTTSKLWEATIPGDLNVESLPIKIYATDKYGNVIITPLISIAFRTSSNVCTENQQTAAPMDLGQIALILGVYTLIIASIVFFLYKRGVIRKGKS